MCFVFHDRKVPTLALVAAGATLYMFDQLSKWMVIRLIPAGDSITVMSEFFSLVHLHNTGAAFGLLSGNNVAFIILSVLALASLVGAAKFGILRGRIVATAAILAAAGILGNLTSRLFYGYVVDLLLFNLHVPLAQPWPAFNVADVCIVAAAILFIATSLLKERRAL